MEEQLMKILLTKGKEAALKWLGEEILIDCLLGQHTADETLEAVRIEPCK